MTVKIKKLTYDDLRLFPLLYEQKVMTTKQINRDVYGMKSIRSLSNRLKRFEDAKIIQAGYSQVRYPEKVFSLTQKGYKNFIENGEECRIQLKSDSIDHDLALVDIRHRLLKDDIANQFITENTLQTWRCFSDDQRYFPYIGLKCDGVMEVLFSDESVRFALEYEANTKTWARYGDILGRYYRDKSVPFVLFICEGRALMTRIMGAERKQFSKEKPKAFYVELADLLGSDTVELCNRDQGKLRIYPKEPDLSSNDRW